MADEKFSAFPSGGQTLSGDIVVGLRGGANYQFTAPIGALQVWNNVSGTSQLAVVNNGYIIGNAGQTTVTLPNTAALGSLISVQGLGAGGWIIQAGTGQTIHIGSSASSSGGTLTSTNLYDSINLICIIANTAWATIGGPQGNITLA